ncbi:MAG: tetratricopeptide repeat protein [Chthoniobacterales bacterium]
MRISIPLVITLALFHLLSPSVASAQNAAQVASKAAEALFNQAKYPEAAQAYEAIVHDYPTSDVVFGVYLQLGYSYYFLTQYDKAIPYVEKFLQSPTASPELKPIAMNLLAQLVSAKASTLPPEDPQRKTLYEDSIKKFTDFVTQFPNSPDIETAVYGRAIANFQIGNYTEAEKDLQANMQKYPRSPSILDSQNLLALSYATEGSKLLISGQDKDKALGFYDKAIELLRDIITKKSDLTLVNAANFQMGEILFNRAGFAPDADKKGIYKEARDVYNSVMAKNDLVDLQQTKVNNVPTLIARAIQQNNQPEVQRLNRERVRQMEKLAQLKGSPDQVLSALLKIGEIYFNQGSYDESRVVLEHLQPLLQSDNDKKRALYFTILSYAAQSVTDKAIAGYNQFQSQYKSDPLGENLPLVIGDMLMNSSNANKETLTNAISYFKQSLELYPKGAYATPSAVSLATAQARIGETEEALKSYQALLQTKLSPSDAVKAQLGIANIYKDTSQLDLALQNYKTVLEKYPDAKPEVTEAEFWIAAVTNGKKDYATAIPLLKAFIAKYPDTPYVSNALFFLGSAELESGNTEQGLATMKELADKHPDSAPAPFTYFRRANVLSTQKKTADASAIMKEFISKYPQDPKVFAAYEYLGMQALSGEKPQADEAIKLYTEYADKYSKTPEATKALLKVAELQQKTAAAMGRYGALNPQEREKWKAALDASVATEERIISTYPDSPDFAATLQSLLKTQELLLSAEIKKPEDIEQYFQKIATSTTSPAARSKTLFTLASFIAEKDKARALETMQKAYDDKIVYAPADMDFYGIALIEQNKLDEAQKVFDKLATDYPIPAGILPNQAQAQIQTAQADALFGKGKIAQLKGKADESSKYFLELKTKYAWSPKILEANYGIAESERQSAPVEAMKLLISLARAPNATTDLRAKSMLLIGYISKDKMEKQTDLKKKDEERNDAIDNFIKISDLYKGVPTIAATGLWEGGQLLEQQASTLTDPKMKELHDKQLSKAKQAYQDLVSNYPNSSYVDKAKERLAALGGAK